MQHFSLTWHCNAPAIARSYRQKKRQRARRHWNSVSERTNLFQTKKPPHLIESGEAAYSADAIFSVFYCSLKSVVAFPVLRRSGSSPLPVFCTACFSGSDKMVNFDAQLNPN
ncbi:hypothetical protein [uncultured Oxalicibacterium sp.]|uniref:hypothetical protein n=1 Tax=uncultured Oxalicibacterium sp. TaxID=1168540 RepID=UPI0025EF3BB4|nr:hypothetical protein [uncultured Oxalicibacterium sp.]